MNPILTFISSMAVASSPTAYASTMDSQGIVASEFAPLVSKDLPKEKRYQSILIGLVTPFETRVIPFGTLTEKGDVATAKTLFEIGSITKGLIGLLLANESLNGSLNLDQPYSSLSHLNLPSFYGKQVTWRHLAQHTAGFPRLPENWKPSYPLQPYADYDLSKLEDFLTSFKLQAVPGTNYDYSNLGAGLAGYGLQRIYKASLEQILRESFLDKMCLHDTRINLTDEQQSRLTPAVFLNGDRVELWKWPETSVLQGAGALRSTMQDMMNLLKTMMGLLEQEDMPMVMEATEPTFSVQKNSQLGLFWNRLKSENIVWHNGGTYGSASFMGYDPDSLVGLVVLSNSQIIGAQGVDPRLDLASLNTIQKIISSLKMDKPVRALKDYDVEIERRRGEFQHEVFAPDDKKWVKAKINFMYDVDQYMRSLLMNLNEQGFTEVEKNFFQQAYRRRFYMMDWQNTRDLKHLMKLHGWFNVSTWGKQADRQAWLLVQHADHDPGFQKEVLQILSTLYKSKETDPSHYAYLYDRVATSFKDPSKRKPQRYGTQGSCVGPGKWEPLPMEDDQNIDKRRAEVGLAPIQEYIEGFKDICL